MKKVDTHTFVSVYFHLTRCTALAVPTRCVQSERDELVSRRSETDLRHHPHIALTTLPDSGHFAYGDGDLAWLKRSFRDFCGGH